jgi:hypothetical protein
LGTTLGGNPYTGDALTLGGTAAGAFADKHAANNKFVTVSGITLGGAQAGHYTLAPPAGLTASVAPHAATRSAVSATTDLVNPNSWQGLSGHTNITGAGQTVDITLPSDGPRMFYRLNGRVE